MVDVAEQMALVAVVEQAHRHRQHEAIGYLLLLTAYVEINC